jgi:ABC-type uncharacterized transport system permease subunit
MNTTFYGAAHLMSVAFYGLAAATAWSRLREPRSGGLTGSVPQLALALALGLHGCALWQDLWRSGEFRFGFAQDLSATVLLAAGLLWIEGLFIPLRAVLAVLAPLAALAVALPMAFHGAPLDDSAALRAHLAASVLAYGLLMIAALNALLMAALDRHLRQPARHAPHVLGVILDAMPSLLSLETLLFRQIALGFILLSATLASGAGYSLERYGHWWRFNHMTLFAVVSWGVFGTLLIGRHWRGWRGRIAQRWVLAGFTTLMLAYIGARFVLEVVLGRVPA